MVTKEEFFQYIKNIIEEDKNKKNIKSLSKSYLISAILLLIVGIIAFLIAYGMYMLLMGVIFIIISIVMFNIRSRSLKYFRDNYRGRAISYLLNGYDYYFTSNGMCGYVDSYDLEKSQFVKEYDVCYVGDYLEINIPTDDGGKSKVDLKLADINACNFSRNKDGELESTSVFKGMFGCVSFPKKFKCILAINTKYKKRGIKLEDVKLENINFNEKIKILSNNQVEARYILTTDMMEKLIYLNERIDNLKILFIDKELYISSKGLNILELNDCKDNDIVSVFGDFYDEIKIILEVVNEIKINNKVFRME